MWTDFLIINGLFFWSPKTMSFLVDSDNEGKKMHQRYLWDSEENMQKKDE